MWSGAHWRRTMGSKASPSFLLTQVHEATGTDPGEDELWPRAQGLSCIPWAQVVSEEWDSRMQANQEVKQWQRGQQNSNSYDKNQPICWVEIKAGALHWFSTAVYQITTNLAA